MGPTKSEHTAHMSRFPLILGWCLGVKSIQGNHMCDVRTRQTAVITFILRINALPFPLCRHISQRGRVWGFYFFFSRAQAVQILPLPHPWRFTLEITHRCAVRLRRTRRKMRNPDLFLSITIPRSAAATPRIHLGCVATSKHFFHARLSSARQLGPADC